MLAFLLLFLRYPLLLGVPKDVRIPKQEMLSIKGVIPDDLCIFIIDRVENPEIRRIQELANFAHAEERCSAVGNLLMYSQIDHEDFNFLEKMRENRAGHIMKIDTGSECPCKAANYRSGLIEVRIPDNSPSYVNEILSSLPTNIAVAFIAASDDLFKY